MTNSPIAKAKSEGAIAPILRTGATVTRIGQLGIGLQAERDASTINLTGERVRPLARRHGPDRDLASPPKRNRRWRIGMLSTVVSAHRTAQEGRQALWRTAEAALSLGIATAIFLTVVWFVSPSSSEGGTFHEVADYLFTGNGVPFGAVPLVLLWTLLKLHGERVGRTATAGVVIASVSLVALIAVLAASVAAGEEISGGPTYILATAGSIIGIWLFCVSAARARLLPRGALFFWAFAWTIGGMLGPKGSQLLLAAAYAVLLVQVHNRAREELG
jgi:hypothetical protein